MRDLVASFREKGFRAFKIGWGPFGRRDSGALDEAIVRAAREGAGADTKLFVDAGASDSYWPQGLKWAMRTAEMLKDYNVGWFEEALKPDAIDDFCHLRRVSPVPIAGGEVLTRRQAFLPFLARGAFDIIQPDVTKVGGISEQLADEPLARLCEPTAESLADAIRGLIESPPGAVVAGDPRRVWHEVAVRLVADLQAALGR